MAVIGSLSVKLGLVTVEWDKATGKARQDAKALQKSFDELGSGLKTLQGHFKTLGGSIGVAGIGFATLLHNALAFSNEIKDVSQGFGISIAKTLQFRDALQTSGVSAEGASKMMSTLFSKIDDAKQGNEVVISQFQKLGISFRELSTMKPEEAINKIFTALAGVKDQYEKIKLTKEFLGKAGIGVDTEDMAKKLNMSLTQYKAYEKQIEKVAQVSDNLKTSMNNLTIAFTDLIAPFTKDGVVSIEKFKYLLLTIGSIGVIKGIQSVGTALMALIPIIKEVNLTVASGGFFTFALALIGNQVATSLSNTEKDLQKAKDIKVTKRMVYDEKTQQYKQVAPELTKEEKEALARKAEAMELTRKELIALNEKARIQKELGKLAVEEVYEKQAMKEMTEYDKTMAEINYEYQKKSLEIEKQRKAEIASNREKTSLHGAINAVYDQEQKNLKDLTEARRKVAEQDEANRQSFEYGWEHAFRKFGEDAQNYSKLGADMFNSLVGSMNSAIDNFVKNGKFNFKDLIKSMIQDLLALQMKMQAMNIVKGLFGGGGFFGSLFGGGATGTTSLPINTSFLGGRAYADGGSPPIGVPSLVGERGAELFVPRQAGTIIPNHQLANMLGGGQTINYNGTYVANMQAIDTQSATQFLAKNKEAVWSANQSASRGLPTSR